MEVLHSTGLTSPLLSQKSVHHFLKNDAHPIFQVPSGRSWHLRIASHPPNCVSKNFELCITPRLANPHLQVTRDKITRCRYNTTTCMHAVAGKSSTITTSDDEGAVGESKENFTQKRFKLLQDDVGPNSAVLEAQARVCTGPTQTRPMDEAQAYKVLNTILQSGNLTIKVFPLLMKFSLAHKIDEMVMILKSNLCNHVRFLCDALHSVRFILISFLCSLHSLLWFEGLGFRV